MITYTDTIPTEALEILSEWKFDGPEAPATDLERNAVLLTWPGGVTEKLLRTMKSLRAIQLYSAGVDDLPFSLIPKDVRVFSNAGAYSTSVAEHAWALLLALAKGINKRGTYESYQLLNKNLLILGCGAIGSLIASIGRAFGMRALGVSRSFHSPETLHERYDLDRLEYCLSISDAIVCSLPLTKYTQNLLDYPKLSKLKSKVILVNIARAEIFDQNAVFRILSERSGTRFGTDVFWRNDGREDFDSGLWRLNNFAGTMHTAGAKASAEVANTAKLRAAENVREYLKTGKAKNEVRREDYA